METSDLDMPLLPSAEQIRRREFQTVRRGYDPEQVRDFLANVADQVESMEREMRDGAGQLPQPPGIAGLAEISGGDASDDATQDPYERIARRFAVVFETADHEAEEIVSRARDESSRILTEARAEADRVRLDAQARAEEARQEGREALERAKREADETMGDLQTRRASLVSQLDGMRSTLLAVADDLQLKTDAPDEHEPDEPTPSAETVAEPAEAEAPPDRSPTVIPSSPAPMLTTQPDIVVSNDDDDVWLFEDALDIPELEFTDPEGDDGSRT